MKCTDEECQMCEEQITSPDAKTLFKIIYQQFLGFEKDLKEENEELCLIIKILLLKIIDDDKIHRISYLILKNTKVSLSTYLKINYIYEKLLEEMNQDLKNLLTIKYGEVYDDLLFIINYFEEIFGFVKSRTEKVELVINKTNEVGQTYHKIIENLFFLKRNKRIYIDTYNMLQIICLIRLIFQKNVDAELTENLEYNFQDFLENVDRIFEENLSFIVRYDFYDFNWRIKKVPKTFMDMTRLRVDDLIDQSLEKIFPSFMAKSIIKELEELIMSNKYDKRITFKTFVLDSEANVRYVKFEVEIIPNLHGNYLLYLHCHFQRKQVMIIDEAGNFVNGCEELYKRIGIKSEVVAMSKGKINMYNLFNVANNYKLEDVKIVSVNIDNLMEIIKKVYLIDHGNLSIDTIPPFLYDLFFTNSNFNAIGNHHGSLIANNNMNNLANTNLGSHANLNNNNNNAFTQGADFTYNASNISRNSIGNNCYNNFNNNATGSQITISANNNLEFLRNNPTAFNMLMNQNMRKFPDNNLIYLNLYQTINLNNRKYIVYSIKIKLDENNKKENNNNNNNNNINYKHDTEDELIKSPKGNNTNNPSIIPSNIKGNLRESTLSIGKDKSVFKSNLTESDVKQSEFNNFQNNLNNNPNNFNSINANINNNNNQNLNFNNEIKNNLADYQNLFNDNTNRSASVEMDYYKFNPNSVNSYGNSSSSDVFSYLLLKNAPKNSNRTHYFKNFLSFIYMLNLFLVAVGLFSIVYLNTYTKNTLNFIETFEIFYKLRTNIISATANILRISKFTNEDIINLYLNSTYVDAGNKSKTSNANNFSNFFFIETFDEYFDNQLNISGLFANSADFSFDSLIKNYNSFYAEIILDSYKNFEKHSYNLYGATEFEKNIDYYTNIITFNSIGNTLVTKNRISDTLDYIPITINTIDKRPEEKIYININYLSFENDFITQDSKLIDPSILNNLSLNERNQFNQNFNLYKFFINYFSVYVQNFQLINNNFFNFGVDYTNTLQLNAKILLIMIVLIHVLFVLVSLLSIFIYKKILLKEFNSLYSISEDSLTKLKEKFKCVEEIIKSEKYPSKVYLELRRIRELESNEKNTKNKPNQSNINNYNKNSVATKSKTNMIGLSNINPNNNTNNNNGNNKLNNNDDNNANLNNFSRNSPLNFNENAQINQKHSELIPLNKNNAECSAENKLKFNEANKTNKNEYDKKGHNSTKIKRKTTGYSQSNNDSKDLALENYYAYNYSGATIGLQKSMSIKNKEKMEEIKKQHSKAQASMLLLSRLNFEFEFINNYVKFIVFMSVFYITLGISVLLILEQKFYAFSKSLDFMNSFIEKNVNIYNYLIGVKLAIILNRRWANTIKPEDFGDYAKYSFVDLFDLRNPEDILNLNKFGFFTEEILISNFDNATNTIFEMETKHSFFSDIYDFEAKFTGANTCREIYSVENEIYKSLKGEDPEVIKNLIALCENIPIMHSNLASIFTNVMREIREILNEFNRNPNSDLISRVELLQNRFRMVDTIFFIFIEPYFNFIKDNLLQTELDAVVRDYFNFLIVIFTLNIFIDFLMLIFIWFKNYKQVIKYVNNIQLVADSITN